MKEFFLQCLKDLESISGLRQLYFLQSDLEDGERRKDVLIAGMVAASQQFPYIPEEAQRKQISKMMVEDQTYDSLNSRVINKWLTMIRGIYFQEASHVESDSSEVGVDFENMSDETKKLVKDYEAWLAGPGSGLKTVPSVTSEEIENIKREDAESREGRRSLAVESKHRGPSAEYMRERELHTQYGLECYDLQTGMRNDDWIPFDEWKEKREQALLAHKVKP